MRLPTFQRAGPAGSMLGVVNLMLETLILCAIFKQTPDLNDMLISLEGKVAIITSVSGDGQVGTRIRRLALALL
jgi:hypothetical protein